MVLARKCASPVQVRSIRCYAQKKEESVTRDRERNNELTSFGWRVLRFSGNEISKTIKNCFVKIERTIGNLGGISGLKGR